MPGVKPRYGGAACAAIATGARSARSASRGDLMGLNIRPSNENGPGKPPGPVTCDQRRSDLADVLRLQALGTLSDLELHRIAFGEAAKALRVVEPLHLTLCHTVQTSALRGTAPDMCDPGHRDQRRAQTKTARQVVLAERRQTGDGATYCLNRGQT